MGLYFFLIRQYIIALRVGSVKKAKAKTLASLFVSEKTKSCIFEVFVNNYYQKAIVILGYKFIKKVGWMSKVIINDCSYSFPGNGFKKNGRKIWSLLSLIDVTYRRREHLGSIQNLWEILILMDYFTPKGEVGRSLNLVTIDQLIHLSDIIESRRGELKLLKPHEFPLCEQNHGVRRISLNPLGFVGFSKEVGFIRIDWG